MKYELISKKVHELGTVVTGKTPPTKQQEYFGTKIPFLTPSDITNSKFVKKTERKLSEKGFNLLKNSKLPPGSIAVSCIGSDMGKTVMINELTITNQQFNSIIPNDLVTSEFLYYYFVNKKQFLKNLAGGGTAQPILKKSLFSDIDVLLPPLKIQTKIGEILTSLDDKIKLLQNQNEILEKTIQSIFKSWFVDFDSQTEFIDSELGKIPKVWSVGKLNDLAVNIKNSIESDEITSESAYIGLEHMPRGSIVLSKWEKADGLLSNKSQFKSNQILFGKLRPYFKKVGVAPINGICSTDILVIDSKTPELFGYVLGILSSDNFINYTDMSSTGTKMPRTDWKIMSEYTLVIPSDGILSQYNKLVNTFNKNIRKNIFEIIKLQTIRDSLIPKLFSGEIRL